MKNKKTSNKKDFFNRVNIIRAGMILSLALNIAFIGVVLVAIQQSKDGKITTLSTGTLLDSTCSSYLNKQKTSVGSTTNVSGIDFYPVYLTDTSDNPCNRIVLSSQNQIKTLLETNNSNAINYYLNTTNLIKTPHPAQIEIPIYYDNKTKLPIDLTTQNFVN